MRKIVNSNYFLVIVYLFFAFLAYGRLPFTFFQQDEWAIFGNYLYWDKAHLDWFTRLFVYQQFTHIIPLSNIVSYLEFKLFGLNFFYHAFFSILIHLFNTFLVYKLAVKTTKNINISKIVGLLFLTNPISHQAITWVATTAGTAYATTATLLSLIFFFDFLNTNRYKKLLLSVLFLFISFFFKETSIFLIPFFFIAYFLRRKEQTFWEKITALTPFILMSGFYILFRLVFLFISPQAPESADLAKPHITNYGYRVFTAPLKSFTQSFIPQKYLIEASKKIIILGYPDFVIKGDVNPYISQSIGVDMVSYAFALFSLFGIAFAVRKNRNALFTNTILLSLSFIALTALPLVFIPGTDGYYSLIDGRHLYITSVFSSILLALFINLFFVSKKRAIAIFSLLLLVMFVFVSSIQIRRDLNEQMGTAFIRTSILRKIITTYPKLPKKVIVYVQSDSPYYGFPYGDNILPFQSGFGQTLVVWYNGHQDTFPACFFKEQYLYIIQSQGYKDCDGRGFGYFRKIEDLKKFMKENNIHGVEIIGFSYISSKNTLEDITQQVKEEIK